MFFVAMTRCRLWAIDRQSFQQIMMKTGLKRHLDHVEFLRTYEIEFFMLNIVFTYKCDLQVVTDQKLIVVLMRNQNGRK